MAAKDKFRNALFRYWSRGPRLPFPVDLGRVRIYILPTNRGALFAVAVLAMIIGSMNYTNNAGFLFAFLLAAMAMMSTLSTQKNLKGLTLISEKHDAVFAGEALRLDLAVKAHGAARYKITAGFQEEARVTHDVPAGETVTFRLPLATPKRGRFQPGRLVFSSTYPFGLFRTWVTLRLESDYLVFPRPLAYPLTGFEAPGTADNTGKGATGPETDDFKELRAYRPGDPRTRIAWKALARGQGPWTKTFEAETGSAACLAWDRVHAPSREKKISHLCHLVLEAHRQKIPYGLFVPGATIEPSAPGSIAHRDRCLTCLALMD